MKPQRCFQTAFCYQVEAAYAGVDENEEATDKSVETDESSEIPFGTPQQDVEKIKKALLHIHNNMNHVGPRALATFLRKKRFTEMGSEACFRDQVRCVCAVEET